MAGHGNRGNTSLERVLVTGFVLLLGILLLGTLGSLVARHLRTGVDAVPESVDATKPGFLRYPPAVRGSAGGVRVTWDEDGSQVPYEVWAGDPAAGFGPGDHEAGGGHRVGATADGHAGIEASLTAGTGIVVLDGSPKRLSTPLATVEGTVAAR